MALWIKLLSKWITIVELKVKANRISKGFFSNGVLSFCHIATKSLAICILCNKKPLADWSSA